MRNLAIIAHVDHGKTTLVDCLLKETGNTFDTERAMDSNDIEMERGITILSKCTSVVYKDYKLNVVDTPGHSDFGGEVERIMSMVDGVCLVVCASEGPMAQTKFVLQKALAHNLKPIVVINKVDRETARLDEVENEVFDLFCNIGANDDQLEYPVLYASAKAGWASLEKKKSGKGVDELLDAVIENIPPPQVDQDGDLKMLITQTESNQYFGRMLIGKIQQGSISVGEIYSSVGQDGNTIEKAKISKIIKKIGVSQVELKTAYAGDIVSVAGFSQSTVGSVLNLQGKQHVIPAIPIDPPMLSMTLVPNDSPLKGKEADKSSITQIKERVVKESQDDVSLRVTDNQKGSDRVTISGRGDLHLGVLFEKMRREGYEMAVTPPQVITKKCEETGIDLEPFEEVEIETDLEYMNMIMEKMNTRKGIMMDSRVSIDGREVLVFKVPSRGLIGFRSELVNDTRGTALMKSQFSSYETYAGDLKRNNKGAIISTAEGKTTAYALKYVEPHGPLFLGPNTNVYPGMVIGEHLLDDDIDMNPVKAKKATNIRAAGSEEQIKLTPPRNMSLEETIAYMRDDELVEITPKNIRLRKQVLDIGERRRIKRQEKNAKQG